MRYDLAFRIIVPKYSNAGERISTDVLAKYAKAIAEKFGGVTVYPSTIGCWVTKDGSLQCEENIVIEADLETSELREEDVKEYEEFVKDIAKRIANDLGQEEVMYTIDVLEDVVSVKGKYRKRIPDHMKERDFFKKLLD